VYIEGHVEQTDPTLNMGYAIYSGDGQLLYWSVTTDQAEEQWPRLKQGPCTVRSLIPSRFLNEGDYRLELIVSLFCKQYICCPQQSAPSIFMQIRGGLSDSPYWRWKRPGLLGPVIPWQVHA
jgi:lipopolysaccharide transport system ATP-binding protein